jgi:GT2 family glycosyltransferase
VIDQLTFVEREEDGRPIRGIAIDYWAYIQSQLLISGWVMGRGTDVDGHQNLEVVLTTVARPDVESAFPSLQSTARGILAVVKRSHHDSFELCGFRLQFPEEKEESGFSDFVCDQRSWIGFLLRTLPAEAPERSILVAYLPVASEMYKQARGFLEQTKGVPGHGGVVVGWSINLPNVKLALVDAAGRLVWLTDAIRWNRADVVQEFNREFGNYSFNAGVLQAWPHPFKFGDEIKLVAFDEAAAYVLASSRWEAAPVEPVSFARWAFELPTPLDRFAERLENHDGAIIESLIARDRASQRDLVPQTHSYGTPVERPKCSMIVPLYGRFDFMLNQMLEFSEDEQIRNHTDLIYVVDDPRIASDVIQQAWLIYEANQIPFRLLLTCENRGFAGANNLGVAISRAAHVLFMNSDVVPVEAGWLGKMLEAIERRPKIGIVGARLFYPNGSIQHDGMTFQWEPSWRAFLNKHPRSGMEATVSPSSRKNEIAVTAACLLMRRDTFEAVGGFDDGFLIGDFEDSDLCLKVKQRGLELICLDEITLVHLERQSFAGIGANGFRERVARYNAWRHQRRWGEYIKTILGHS